MLDQMCDRGPDSAGIAVYGDPTWSPAGHSTVSVLGASIAAEVWAGLLSTAVGVPITAHDLTPTTVLHGPLGTDELVAAVRVSDPTELATSFGLPQAQGWQGVGHTRMATESAVTAAGSHPFSVGTDQCLVHNGSFSNHMSIKHQLERHGTVFDSENDTEVGARFVARQLAGGADLEKALLLLNETFDGFYTLLVSTSDSFAVVREAIIAETEQWVAMASEFRALAELPGIDRARIFEPEPEEVYVWHRQ
jgi:glutamate synthase domain-containing protein 1